jgi:hypothetical protein
MLKKRIDPAVLQSIIRLIKGLCSRMQLIFVLLETVETLSALMHWQLSVLWRFKNYAGLVKEHICDNRYGHSLLTS